MMHDNPHALAGKTVVLNGVAADAVRGIVERGERFRVEDYWDRLTGTSWMDCDGNPAAIQYAMRAGLGGLPTDNEVVYGKIGDFGHLVHVTELGEEAE